MSEEIGFVVPPCLCLETTIQRPFFSNETIKVCSSPVLAASMDIDGALVEISIKCYERPKPSTVAEWVELIRKVADRIEKESVP